jgi:aspartate aminotransferase
LILDEEKVATVPGISFGAPDCVRLSYALSDQDIEEGLKRIARFVAALK